MQEGPIENAPKVLQDPGDVASWLQKSNLRLAPSCNLIDPPQHSLAASPVTLLTACSFMDDDCDIVHGTPVLRMRQTCRESVLLCSRLRLFLTPASRRGFKPLRLLSKLQKFLLAATLALCEARPFGIFLSSCFHDLGPCPALRDNNSK